MLEDKKLFEGNYFYILFCLFSISPVDTVSVVCLHAKVTAKLLKMQRLYGLLTQSQLPVESTTLR